MSLGASAQIVGFNNNLTKIVAQLNTTYPGCYSIKGNNTVVFTNISEDTFNKITALKLDPNGYSGGSFISTFISDVQTSVNSSNSTSSSTVTTTQRYHKNVNAIASMQINFLTSTSYNTVIQDIEVDDPKRYQIADGETFGEVYDYNTAKFGVQSTDGVEKLISGMFVSTIFCPPGSTSILACPPYVNSSC